MKGSMLLYVKFNEENRVVKRDIENYLHNIYALDKKYELKAQQPANWYYVKYKQY